MSKIIVSLFIKRVHFYKYNAAKYINDEYGYNLNILDEYPTGVWEEINRKLEIKLDEKLNSSIHQYKKEGNVIAMVDLLVGNGDSKISENERKPHYYYDVIERIHKFYEEKKDEDIIKMYEKGIIAILDNFTLDAVDHFYNVIGTESEHEDRNPFSFKLNVKKISKVFEDAIASNMIGLVHSNPYWRDVVRDIRSLLRKM